MTKGKIVNKQTGLEIPGDIWVRSMDRIQFLIAGDHEVKTFARSAWDFIEDQPSAYEQFLALKQGARFTINEDGKPIDNTTRIKLDDDTYAYEDGPAYWETNGSVGALQKSSFSVVEEK